MSAVFLGWACFILCVIPAVHVICEPTAKTKLQLLNCTQWTEQFLVEKEAISSGEALAFAPLLLLEVLTASPKSHILTLLSRPPEASSVPSALKARLYTESECPRNSLTILPADRSHRRMRRSSPADTRYCPSGEIARSCIEPYKQTYINYYCRESSINSPGGIFISNTFEGA